MTKVYGADEFINKVRLMLAGKYDKELAALQGDQATLQQIKIQSLIQLEVLAELRKLNSAMVETQVVELPSKEIENALSVTGLTDTMAGVKSAPNTPKGA